MRAIFKIVLLILALFLCQIGLGQKISVEAAYLPGGYNVKYSQPVPATSGGGTFETTFPYGRFMTNVACAVTVKKLEIYGSQRLYMEPGRFMRPTQAEWTLGLGYRINNWQIGCEHLCVHPVCTDATPQIQQFGGYNKIYIKYEINIGRKAKN